MADRTTDTFFNGLLSVTQSLNGYRFSIDSVILAAALEPKAGQKIVDLGTGCGIIPLIVAHRHADIQIVGVEMQTDMVDLACGNVRQNRMAKRVTIINEDIRQLTSAQTGGLADLVVSNPPYRRTDSGRINPDAQRAIARHEIHLNLAQLLQAVRKLLRTGGRFATIYPAERMVDLFSEMRGRGIEPKRLRMIHSRNAEAAKLILAEGVMRGNPGLKIDPPLIIYRSDGSYTREMQAMMSD